MRDAVGVGVGVESELAFVVVVRVLAGYCRVIAEQCCLGRCESPGEGQKGRCRRHRIGFFLPCHRNEKLWAAEKWARRCLKARQR